MKPARDLTPIEDLDRSKRCSTLPGIALWLGGIDRRRGACVLEPLFTDPP
jgi:hypothetical protein